jgi:signal transduction histidine kinase
MVRKSGQVYLTAGRHPLRLAWFNALGKFGLELSYQGPGLEHQRIPDSALFHLATDPASGHTNLVNGLVLKHSQASEVRIRVAATDATVEIVVEDNGSGFNPSANGNGDGSRGNGLANMRQRLERLGGVFDLNTAPGEGTRLRFTVKVDGLAAR